jgi:hypothetical protein
MHKIDLEYKREMAKAADALEKAAIHLRKMYNIACVNQFCRKGIDDQRVTLARECDDYQVFLFNQLCNYQEQMGKPAQVEK